MEENPMKRIAFAAAAAALLGTGCSSSPQEYGSVNLYWSFAKTAPAQSSGHIDYDTSYVGTSGPCAQSGVEQVTVDSAVGQTTVDCVHTNGVQGLGLDGLPAGLQTLRVRGWRGTYAVYDGAFQVSVPANAVADQYVAVAGVSAPLDLFAYLAWGSPTATNYATCADASWPNVGYEIRDVWGTLVDDGTVGCSDPLPAAVYVGDLDLDNYKVRMQGFAVAGGALVLDSCSVALDHFDAQIGANGLAPVLYTQPLPTCP
jgi:hypothetical protein